METKILHNWMYSEITVPNTLNSKWQWGMESRVLDPWK